MADALATSTAVATVELPKELIERGQGETGMTAQQVQVLSKTLLKDMRAEEMALVFHQAKEYGLSVFRKEIFAYKDNRGNLVTVTGRDGLLKVAAKNPNFGGLRSGAVYKNDVCEIDLGAGTVVHKPALTDRGTLLGAWAAVYRKGFDPLVMYVTVESVRRNTPIWTSNPAVMVLARAESMALRRADVGVGGIYLEDEVSELAPVDKVEKDHTQVVKEIEQKATEAAATVKTKRKKEKAKTEELSEPIEEVEIPNKTETSFTTANDVGASTVSSNVVILASNEDVAELRKLAGGDTYLKKWSLREFGHDNVYILSVGQAALLRSKMEQSTQQRTPEVQPVDVTPDQVAADEIADGPKASKKQIREIGDRWTDAGLPDTILVQRKTEGSLKSHIQAVLQRSIEKLTELTPTEAERVISTITSRNQPHLTHKAA